MNNISNQEIINSLIDLLDGNSIEDIIRFTGLSYERAKQIKETYIKLIEYIDNTK